LATKHDIVRVLPLLNCQGVESERCASFQAAIAAGKPVYTEVQTTLADGNALSLLDSR